MPDGPLIDLQSDHYFMGEALRQAARAYEAEEVPVGAVIVRGGRIIARALNQVQFATLNHRCEITAGVRDAECRAMLRNFFVQQRASGKDVGGSVGG